MKKPLSYPELWKQKQRELPVKDNPDAAWLKTRALLDERLPVSATVKKPYRFKIPKWGLKVLLGVSTVAAIYLADRLYFAKTHPDQAKPGMQQLHRDSVATTAKPVSPARDTINPATGTSTPEIAPIASGTDTRLNDAAKLSNGRPVPTQRLSDSGRQPAVLDVPVHRDSLLAPVQAVPLRPLYDSIAPVELMKKDVQKDTSNAGSKAPKKKKRRKISVFY